MMKQKRKRRDQPTEAVLLSKVKGKLFDASQRNPTQFANTDEYREKQAKQRS